MNENPVIASDSNVIGIGELDEDSKPLVYKTQDFDENDSFNNRETYGWLVYQKRTILKNVIVLYSTGKIQNGKWIYLE